MTTISSEVFKVQVEAKRPGMTSWEPLLLEIRAYRVVGGEREHQLVADDADGETGELFLTHKMASGGYVWQKLTPVEDDDGEVTDLKEVTMDIYMKKSINDSFLAWLDRQIELDRYEISEGSFR